MSEVSGAVVLQIRCSTVKAYFDGKQFHWPTVEGALIEASQRGAISADTAPAEFHDFTISNCQGGLIAKLGVTGGTGIPAVVSYMDNEPLIGVAVFNLHQINKARNMGFLTGFIFHPKFDVVTGLAVLKQHFIREQHGQFKAHTYPECILG